jgi:hypothetical protein
MRETAVPAPEILYMNEYSIYNLIWIEIRLKLKLRACLETQAGDTVSSSGVDRRGIGLIMVE